MTFPLEYRRRQLRQLALLVQENSEQLCGALQADLNKPKFEAVVTELLPIVNACRTAIEKLEEWTTPEKPEVPEWRRSFDISIHPVPKGVALMISSVVLLSPLTKCFIDDRRFQPVELSCYYLLEPFGRRNRSRVSRGGQTISSVSQCDKHLDRSISEVP